MRFAPSGVPAQPFRPIASAICSSSLQEPIMTTAIQALTDLSHRVTRSFHRLFNRLTRKAEPAITVTLAIPPFLKVNLAYQADLAKSELSNAASRDGE
jgi:hypothetical protein